MDGIGLVIFGRFLFALVALALAVVAGFLFATIITANGATWLHFAQVCLLIVCCMWLAWGFNTAVAGIFFSRGKPNRRGGVLAPASVNRSAVLVPVYNEDADAVMARVAAMIEGLRRIRRLEAFDFFVLSDSTKPNPSRPSAAPSSRSPARWKRGRISTIATARRTPTARPAISASSSPSRAAPTPT